MKILFLLLSSIPTIIAIGLLIPYFLLHIFVFKAFGFLGLFVSVVMGTILLSTIVFWVSVIISAIDRFYNR